MDKDAQRAIASKGGRAAHARGTAHEFTSEEAAEAGRKGGRTVSRDRRHMAEIGRRGGKAAHNRQTPEAPSAEQRREPAEQHLAHTGEQPMGNGHAMSPSQQPMGNGHGGNGHSGNGHATPNGQQPMMNTQPTAAPEHERMASVGEPVGGT